MREVLGGTTEVHAGKLVVGGRGWGLTGVLLRIVGCRIEATMMCLGTKRLL